MRLGIDLDGVVANFIEGWMTRYNLEFGTSLTPDLVEHWDAASDLTHFTDLCEFWDWAGAGGSGPSVFRNLSLYPGAKRTLCDLAADHDIVILSMKPDWAAADTFAWIGDRHIPTREVHLLRDKWLVDCDIYLDDSPHVIPRLVENRPGSVVCRYVRPWNEQVAGAADVYGWEDFAGLVNREASRPDRPR